MLSQINFITGFLHTLLGTWLFKRGRCTCRVCVCACVCTDEAAGRSAHIQAMEMPRSAPYATSKNCPLKRWVTAAGWWNCSVFRGICFFPSRSGCLPVGQPAVCTFFSPWHGSLGWEVEFLPWFFTDLSYVWHSCIFVDTNHRSELRVTFLYICWYESQSTLAGVAVLEVESKAFWKEGSYWENLRTGQLSAGPVSWKSPGETSEGCFLFGNGMDLVFKTLKLSWFLN